MYNIVEMYMYIRTFSFSNDIINEMFFSLEFIPLLKWYTIHLLWTYVTVRFTALTGIRSILLSNTA